MKKYSKVTVAVLAVLCIALCLFGIFGYSTKYGDITTTTASDATMVNMGLGLENYVEMTYSYADDPSDAELSAAMKVLAKRVEALGIMEYEMAVDKEMKFIAVYIARGDKSAYGVSDVFYNIGKTGLVEVRAGAETDEEGRPSGVTASTVICTNEGLVKAVASSELYYGSMYLDEFVLTYTGDAKKAIAEYTAKAIEESDSRRGTYSLWIDGTKVSERVFDTVIKDGILNCGDNTYKNVAQNAFAPYAMIINSGKLGVELKDDTIFYHTSPDMGRNYEAVLYGLGIVCVLAMIYWIARYKVMGLASALSLCGMVGVVLMMVTGSFYYTSGIFFTYTGLCALAAGIIVAVLSHGNTLYSVKRILAVQSPQKAVKAVCVSKGKLWLVLSSVSTAATLVLFILGLFVHSLRGYFNIAHGLTVVFVATYLFMVLVFRACALSLGSFAAFKDEKAFGGAAK